MLDKEELKRRLNCITGAFFDPHAQQRARQRLHKTLDFDKYEQKIIELQGRIYRDTQEKTFTIEFKNAIFPFDLKTHESKPGLLAYVPTSYPASRKAINNLQTNERYQRIKNTEYSECPFCDSETNSQTNTALKR